MATRKGKMIYVPNVVIKEVEDIMRENKVKLRAHALKEMVDYTKVGREAERIMKFKKFRVFK